MENEILVSIIIPTKNEESNLPRLLHSIKNQSVKEIEVIIVDNSSSDKTKKIGGNFGARVLDHGPERSPQRNFGAKESQSKYLLFLDADMELSTGVIKQCLKMVKDTEIKALIIPEKSVGEGFWARAKALERETYVGADGIEAARFFEKEVFFEVGGYDEKLIAAEDWDLHNRFKEKGFKISRIQEEIIHHESKLGFINSVKKKFYYGKNINQYLAKKGFSYSQLSPIRPSYLRHWRLFISHPIITLGFVILKSSELLALFLGLVLSSFKLTK